MLPSLHNLSGHKCTHLCTTHADRKLNIIPQNKFFGIGNFMYDIQKGRKHPRKLSTLCVDLLTIYVQSVFFHFLYEKYKKIPVLLAPL